jgi:predicted membrane protein
MKANHLTLLNKILPFFFIGIFIVLIFCAIVFFSSLLLIGTTVGFILITVAFIREKIFKTKNKTIKPFEKKKGNTYDHKA